MEDLQSGMTSHTNVSVRATVGGCISSVVCNLGGHAMSMSVRNRWIRFTLISGAGPPFTQRAECTPRRLVGNAVPSNARQCVRLAQVSGFAISQVSVAAMFSVSGSIWRSITRKHVAYASTARPL